MTGALLLSSAYLPPAGYLKTFLSNGKVTLDSSEHFIKQTLRNRCHILSPNGIQSLIIPVVHDHRTNTSMRDIRISNHQPWQRQHWRSMEAAYRRSAYFEFYMDEFAPFYLNQQESLLEFNTGLLRLVLNLLKIDFELSFTEKYIRPGTFEGDLRHLCNTGTSDSEQLSMKYPQVFSYKGEFSGGLSIVDLLFNLGPAAKDYLGKI